MIENMNTQASAAVFHFIYCLNSLTSVTSLDQRNSWILNWYREIFHSVLDHVLLDICCQCLQDPVYLCKLEDYF